jgi:hypothetical protein
MACPSRRYRLEGEARSDGGVDEALTNTVTPAYLQTMGIPIVAGHDFGELRDTALPPQAIVNETFARHFGVDPHAIVGRTIATGDSVFTIVGVARDSLAASFGETPQPFIYVSWRDRPSAMAEIHVRTRPGAETAVTSAVRDAVRVSMPRCLCTTCARFTDHVEANLVFRRIPARMFVVIGPVVLLLVAWASMPSWRTAWRSAARKSAPGSPSGATVRQVTRALMADTFRVVLLGMAGGGVVALMIDPSALEGRVADTVLLAGVGALFPGHGPGSRAGGRPARRVRSIRCRS